MNIERYNMKYFYTTGSNCTSSLAAVNACISQSINNCITKFQISSSAIDPDFYPSASYHNVSSDRMSEILGVKTEHTPMIVFEFYGSGTELGMEQSRVQENNKFKITQDWINKTFNAFSSSIG